MNYQVAIMLAIGFILSVLSIYIKVNRFIQPICVALVSLAIYNIFIYLSDGDWVIYKDPLWSIFFALYSFYTIVENVAVQLFASLMRKLFRS